MQSMLASHRQAGRCWCILKPPLWVGIVGQEEHPGRLSGGGGV